MVNFKIIFSNALIDLFLEFWSINIKIQNKKNQVNQGRVGGSNEIGFRKKYFYPQIKLIFKKISEIPLFKIIEHFFKKEKTEMYIRASNSQKSYLLRRIFFCILPRLDVLFIIMIKRTTSILAIKILLIFIWIFLSSHISKIIFELVPI